MTSRAHPFRYPSAPHVRRHGPAGYRDWRDYRPWLEDEFHFRCVYCLKRQVWAPTDVWSVEHVIPRREAPERECDYDNLVLACQFCNNTKLAATVPDPVAVAYGNCLKLEEESGKVNPLNEDGHILIRVLKLNHRKQIGMRCLWLEILALCDPGQWARLMGFPRELPNLCRKDPPGGNTRPEGLAQSCHARQQRGELPKVYE